MNEILEFQVWRKWVSEHGRCQAITSKGRQCRNACAGMGWDICNDDDYYDVEFVLGETDRCHCHCQKSEKSRRQ